MIFRVRTCHHHGGVKRQKLMARGECQHHGRNLLHPVVAQALLLANSVAAQVLADVRLRVPNLQPPTYIGSTPRDHAAYSALAALLLSSVVAKSVALVAVQVLADVWLPVLRLW